MATYRVNDVLQKFIGYDEVIQFDITDYGATLIVCFNEPTQNEIQQMKANSPFQIRYVTIYDVIVLAFKFGSLNWMDAPYNPHLSKYLTSLPLITDKTIGLSLQVFFVNGKNGVIENIRVIGLSHKFSNVLISSVQSLWEKDFDEHAYDQNINSINTRYSTNSIIKLSNTYYSC